MTMQTTSAQAAGQYYNCANATGCELVSSKHWTSNHTDTKYPVVLVHGANGFNRLFGVLDYFYGIPQALINGGSNVFATKTSAIHNSEFRGEQLLQQVKIISAISGSPKVNLLGHSQGGIDIRYVAAMPTSYCGQPADTEVNGIKYYSFSGVGQITNGLDPSDYLLATTGLAFAGEPNDGLVSSCSSRLGYVIRDNYKMNHLDSVNQVVGLTAWGQPNPKSLYTTQVNRLKNESL
ncbi:MULTISPECIES: hypothetical protein [Psychrobacter]|jgi:triacylglycerol esterase/lipase EstA (alpha/beta hydrolase family)|uniref:esterase/lipase family protein n=1 Tax=Psychrobacter TaxID=497 RepID=UPI0004154D22|nr:MULTISPECIES: hypothetical protein [Psychrobacter]